MLFFVCPKMADLIKDCRGWQQTPHASYSKDVRFAALASGLLAVKTQCTVVITLSSSHIALLPDSSDDLRWLSEAQLVDLVKGLAAGSGAAGALVLPAKCKLSSPAGRANPRGFLCVCCWSASTLLSSADSRLKAEPAAVAYTLFECPKIVKTADTTFVKTAQASKSFHQKLPHL